MKKLALPLILALAIAIPAAAAGGKTYLGGCSPSDHARFKPRHIIAACGDAGVEVRRAKWGSWHSKRARGRGRARVNDCNPNCAQGTSHRYKVRLRASNRHSCAIGPKHQFLTLKVIFRNNRPAGFPKRLTFSRTCSRR